MEGRSYIKHLAGLRGVAILLVILFHIYGQGIWENGYLGVDIFLVITGYLMFRGRLAGARLTGWRDFFSYLLRRIQRIAPAMLIIIFVSVGIGMLLLRWRDEQLLSMLGYAACLAKANVKLRQEFANYFAPDADYIPLLHLWYLSVILQVYLLYAVGNLILQRLPGKIIVAVLTTLGVASLLYNYSTPIAEWLSALGAPTDGIRLTVSYYRTLPRIWEILAGGLVCILPGFNSKRVACIVTVAGLACVVFAVSAPVILNPAAFAKVPYTLVTVLGTVLLLRYTPHCPVIDRILSNKVLLWLGAVSFSLYLVHMPVVVYLRVWTLGQPGIWVELLMIAVSTVLGYLLMLGIEKRRLPFWVTAALWVATLLLCRAGRKTDGFKAYFPASNLDVSYTDWKMCKDMTLAKGMSPENIPFSKTVFNAMNQVDKAPGKARLPLLVMGSERKPVTCVLLGDSHAGAIYAGLDVALKAERISGVYLASYFYTFHDWKEDRSCSYKELTEREKALMKWLRAQTSVTHVIVAQRWRIRVTPASQRQRENDLRVFLREIRDAGKKAVVIAPTPEFPGKQHLLRFEKIFPLRHFSSEQIEKLSPVCSAESYLRINSTVLPMLYKMRDEGLCTLIEPIKTLQPGEVFRTVHNGKILMNDDNHMNPGLSIPLVQKLRPALRKTLSRSPSATPISTPHS